jgi:hypothetical protein
MVAHDYVERIVTALRRGVDCCSLNGVIPFTNKKIEKFNHSIHNKDHYSDGTYWRTPNHINAVKREIALEARFPTQNVGEDATYAARLTSKLKTEANTGDAPLYFYFAGSEDSVQKQQARP